MRLFTKTKFPLILLLGLLFTLTTKAQVTFLFSSPTVDSGSNKAYTLAGVGAYYKNSGLSSITAGSLNCNGSTASATGGGSGFIFRTDVANVIGIIIYGQGTGSNRVLTSMSTSSSLTGTYTTLASATSTSKMVTATVCDSLLIFTGTPISAGTFMQFNFPGNINVTSIVLLTSGSLNAPTVITASPSSVTFNSAVSGGNVTNNGNVTITSRGILYGTSANPQLNDGVSTQITDPAVTTGSYTASLTSLTPSTLYHVQAYATNAVGTSYGGDSTFTTPAATPTLSTNPASLGFGTNSVDSSSLQGFNLSGTYLSADGAINVTAPTNFLVSLNSAGPFTSSVQVPYTGTTFSSTTIYVQFIPTTSANYNANIVLSGGGIEFQPFAVTGTGTTASLSTTKGLSNVGRDFWTGFGASEKMFNSSNNGDGSPGVNSGESNAGGTSGTGSSSSDPDVLFTFNNPTSVTANVTIAIPGMPAFTPITYQVSPNSQFTTPSFIIPQSWNSAMAVDARLDSEGVSSKAIHITSDTDIVVYQHAFTQKVYAASLLFPTPTLGKQYTSLNYKQVANSIIGRSYCFAVAADTGTTVIQVTLPAGIATQTHAAGSTFTDTLQQGQVLNLFGQYIGNDPGKSGYYDAMDLSGVTFNAFGANGTSCKKLAFFSGSSKIGIACNIASNSPTGENLFQQVFPSQVWGYKYVVVPTASLYINKIRVLINNPATNITVDGTPITSLTTLDATGTFYELTNTDSTTHIINSDKPIMVAEYIVNPQQCGNPDVNGDANMVYLSSIQQGIDTVSVVSGGLSGSVANAHFINVAMKTNIINTFKLDGVPSASSFRPVAYDPTYSFAQFSVSAGTHTLASADSGFTATAYGLGSAESYSYNAGTSLKDLVHLSSTTNTLATGSAGSSGLPCRNAPFVLTVTLPYPNPAYIIWDFSNNPLLTPNKPDTLNNLVPVDSSVNADGTKLYKFTDTVTHIYSVIGHFNFNVIAQDPTADGCASQTITFTQQVDRGPLANFTFPSQAANCSGLVQFTDSSLANGGTLNRWVWNYGDGTPVSTDSSVESPSHNYVAGGNYTVKLRAYTAEGCYADTSKALAFGPTVPPIFTQIAAICSGSTAPTLPTTSTNGITGTWSPSTVDNTTTATYTFTPGEGQCSRDTTMKITVNNGTIAPTFAAVPAICSGATAPVLPTTSTNNIVGSWSPVVSNTATGTYTFTPTAGQCATTTTLTVTVNNGTITPTFAAVAPICTGADLAALPATSTNSITGSWSPALNNTATTTYTFTPIIGQCGTTTTLTINVLAIPNITVTANPTTVTEGNQVTLVGTSDVAGASYTWTSTSAITNATDSVATSKPQSTSTYNLAVVNGSCPPQTGSVTVTVIAQPCQVKPLKFFSPNGDGNNDIWKLNSGDCNFPAVVSVYNRWGGLVFHSGSYDNTSHAAGFDGTYKGSPLPDGTYYYVVQIIEPGNTYTSTLTGNVTIVR